MDEPAGQLSSPLAGGGLALSAAKPIEEGARAALLLAPGLFRLDVCPREDTLKLQVRNLSGGPCAWSEGTQPLLVLGFDGPAISAHALRIEVDGHVANVLISATRDTEVARKHHEAQAVLAVAQPQPA